MDQGSNKNHSPAYNFTPTVTKFCVMWEGLSLPHDTKFGNCRCKIVDSRSFHSWSLIHGLRWSGLIKVGPRSKGISSHSIDRISTEYSMPTGAGVNLFPKCITTLRTRVTYMCHWASVSTKCCIFHYDQVTVTTLIQEILSRVVTFIPLISITK